MYDLCNVAKDVPNLKFEWRFDNGSCDTFKPMEDVCRLLLLAFAWWVGRRACDTSQISSERLHHFPFRNMSRDGLYFNGIMDGSEESDNRSHRRIIQMTVRLSRG